MSVIGLTFHLYMSILLVILDFYFPPSRVRLLTLERLAILPAVLEY